MKMMDLVHQLSGGPGLGYKTQAAIGELLAADSKFNLWAYHVMSGRLAVGAVLFERALKRYSEIWDEVGSAWPAQPGSALASEWRSVNRCLVGAAAEIDGFVSVADFYDDDGLGPDTEPVVI